MNDFSLIDIASEHGTPLYLYDWDNIENNILEFTNAFGDDVLYRYAAKAFICKKLVELLDKNKWGIDVVSGGEMATVLSSIETLENTLFNGTYKTREEVNFFISNNGIFHSFNILEDEYFWLFLGDIVENVKENLASAFFVGKSLLFASRGKGLTWEASDVNVDCWC